MSGEPEAAQVTTGHDMSRFWRLVTNDGGLITGTWWVTRPRGDHDEQHVTPIDVTMWDEGRHSGVVLHSENFTAFVRDGVVEPIRVHSRHSHVEAEAAAHLDELAATVLAVAAGPDWPPLDAPSEVPQTEAASE